MVGAHAWALKTLHAFRAQARRADGDEPETGLLRESSGSLCGTTASGSACGEGVVFELVPKIRIWRYRHNNRRRHGNDGGTTEATRAPSRHPGITTIGANPNFLARRANLRSSKEAILLQFP